MVSHSLFKSSKFTFELHFQRYVADVGKSWGVLIVCGGILPVFLSVIWLLMIRHFVAAMPWITVVLFNGLIVSVTMFYYLKGRHCSLVFSLCRYVVIVIHVNFQFYVQVVIEM